MFSDFEEKERVRFQIELEFVQCLANPNYLNFLAQRGYFKDKSFVNYLKYLHSYWTKPAYVKFLKYPLCLHFLELLQHEEFRKEIINGQVKKQSLKFRKSESFCSNEESLTMMHKWQQRVG